MQVKTDSEQILTSHHVLPDHLDNGVRKRNGQQTCLTNEPSITVLEGSVCDWGGAKNFLGALCFLLKFITLSLTIYLTF